IPLTRLEPRFRKTVEPIRLDCAADFRRANQRPRRTGAGPAVGGPFELDRNSLLDSKPPRHGQDDTQTISILWIDGGPRGVERPAVNPQHAAVVLVPRRREVAAQRLGQPLP